MIVKNVIQATRKAADAAETVLTLDSPSGWNLESDAGVPAGMKVSAVYRCIDYNSDTISIMPTFLMNRLTRERITDHPLGQVLWVRPNEAMTPRTYKKLMDANRHLRGNAYAYIARNPKTGRVEALIPMPPDFVEPRLDEQHHLYYLFTEPSSGKVFKLLPCDVLHYKGFTMDGITGISTLAFAREAIQKDRSAKRYERRMYDSGGHPSGVLTTDADLAGLSDKKAPDGSFYTKKDLVRQAWERVHSGADNAFRTAVLDLGLKYQPISMNNSDAQFVESNDITIADIARFFGTPLHALMAGKQSYESNLQNRVEFVQTTALAVVTDCEEEDSFKLLSKADVRNNLRIRRNMDAALRGDTTSRASFYETMWRIGAFSANDTLALEDRPNVPGGDVRIARLDGVPLEDFREISHQRNRGDANGN